MIEVINLTKEFKTPKKYEGFKGAVKSFFSSEHTIKKAVDEMSFHIKEGESVGYIGVNGAGKSTTIKMMTGILVPSGGECRVNGLIPYENRKKNAKNIGVVFGQRTQLWWDLPVSESFSILQKIYDIPIDKYRKNLDYLKEMLGLEEFYLTPVRNLSLGQKMRADFAASLLHEPKVLFLDEPTIGLDVLVKDKIRKAVREINQEKKTTVILTTHDLDDIEEICRKIIVIDDGKKIYEGSLSELKKKYGKYKEVKFELKDIKDSHKIEKIFKSEMENKNVILEKKDEVLEVKFLKEKYQIADIINMVIKETEIRDITIEETKMEDIVKEIYSKN